MAKRKATRKRREKPIKLEIEKVTPLYRIPRFAVRWVHIDQVEVYDRQHLVAVFKDEGLARWFVVSMNALSGVA